MTILSTACVGLLLGGPAAPKDQPFDGKVVPVARPVAAVADAEADAHPVALVTADGVSRPLVRDDVTRKLFEDPELHDRPVRLVARPVAGGTALKVARVYTLKDGVPHEVYYFCDQCQLRAEQPGPCRCCGGPTLLVETPAKAK